MFKLLSILFLIPITTLLAEPNLETTISPEQNATVPVLNGTVLEKKKPAVELNAIKEKLNTSRPRTNPLVYDRTARGDMDEVYKSIFTALENNSYYVLFEPNIGKNLAFSAKRWASDYNKNKLKSIRSMIFCNAWYANKISNIDPSMLAICPLHITLYSKNNETHILFIRPGRIAARSKAHKIAKELEDDVIRAIEIAIANL